MIISRKEAIKQGLDRYFTGKPCKHGHIADRKVNDWRCVECQNIRIKEWYAKNPGKRNQHTRTGYINNPEAFKERSKRWVKNNPAISNAKTYRYRAKKLNAIPNWLNSDHKWMIEEIYKLAQERTKLTGINWHVDHVIPLQGDLVSGLHVPWNLQVITATENQKKSNLFWQ